METSGTGRTGIAAREHPGRRSVHWILLGALLAGCAEAPTEPSPDPLRRADEDGNLPADGLAANASVAPSGAWPDGATERLLYDGTVEATECLDSPEGTIAGAAGTTMYGCATVPLVGANAIPPGTAVLRVDVDVRRALQRGSYYVELWTMNRNTAAEARTEGTAEPARTWEIPLQETDWTPPGAHASLSRLDIWSKNDATTVSTLDGPVVIRAVAIRDPTWVPTQRDHWNATTAPHAFPQSGVVALLYESGPWSQGAGYGVLEPGDPHALTDTIPPETSYVVLGITWTLDGCPPLPSVSCRLYANVDAGGAVLHFALAEAHRDMGPRHSIWIYASPDPVGWDASDATESQTSFAALALLHCESPGFTGTCGDPPTGVTGAATFLVEAWREEVDLEAFKARLVAP